MIILLLFSLEMIYGRILNIWAVQQASNQFHLLYRKWSSKKYFTSFLRFFLFWNFVFEKLYFVNDKNAKGAVSVILSDYPCRDDNARFTTVLLKVYLINNVEDISLYPRSKFEYFVVSRYLIVFISNNSNMFFAVEMRKLLFQRTSHCNL